MGGLVGAADAESKRHDDTTICARYREGCVVAGAEHGGVLRSNRADLEWFGLADTDRCSFDDVEEWRHMLFDGPLYQDGRNLADWDIAGVECAIRLNPRKF